MTSSLTPVSRLWLALTTPGSIPTGSGGQASDTASCPTSREERNDGSQAVLLTALLRVCAEVEESRLKGGGQRGFYSRMRFWGSTTQQPRSSNEAPLTSFQMLPWGAQTTADMTVNRASR